MMKPDLQNPLVRRLAWWLYAVVFYYAGLVFTTWLLVPAQFHGGWQWVWVVAFPFLLVLFFILGRYWGCGSGACAARHCDLPPAPNGADRDSPPPGRMPG